MLFLVWHAITAITSKCIAGSQNIGKIIHQAQPIRESAGPPFQMPGGIPGIQYRKLPQKSLAGGVLAKRILRAQPPPNSKGDVKTCPACFHSEPATLLLGDPSGEHGRNFVACLNFVNKSCAQVIFPRATHPKPLGWVNSKLRSCFVWPYKRLPYGSVASQIRNTKKKSPNTL